jgi:hypothetical protein
VRCVTESTCPTGIRIERFGWTFCPGDKAMQLEHIAAGLVRKTGWLGSQVVEEPGRRVR